MMLGILSDNLTQKFRRDREMRKHLTEVVNRELLISYAYSDLAIRHHSMDLFDNVYLALNEKGRIIDVGSTDMSQSFRLKNKKIAMILFDRTRQNRYLLKFTKSANDPTLAQELQRKKLEHWLTQTLRLVN
jgi:hypothetical protein